MLEFFDRDAPSFDKRFFRFGCRRIIVFEAGILERTLRHDRRKREIASAFHRGVNSRKLGQHIPTVRISTLDVVDEAVELPSSTLEAIDDLLARRHERPSP